MDHLPERLRAPVGVVEREQKAHALVVGEDERQDHTGLDVYVGIAGLDRDRVRGAVIKDGWDLQGRVLSRETLINQCP